MQTFQIRSIILTFLVLSPLTACSVVHDSIAQQRTETANVGANSRIQNEGATATRGVVKALRANLRDKPSRSGKVVTELEKDEALVLIRSTPIGPWYRVKESKTGLQRIECVNWAKLTTGAKNLWPVVDKC
jgi:uncharacterized protein YgiM (DUF1202 family)